MTLDLRNRRRLCPVAFTLAFAALSAADVASAHGWTDDQALRAPLRVEAPHGFTIRPIGVWRNGRGIEAHGWLCRLQSGARTPTRIRLDELDARGAVVATQAAALSGTAPREGSCLIFRVVSGRALGEGDALSISTDSEAH